MSQFAWQFMLGTMFNGLGYGGRVRRSRIDFRIRPCLHLICDELLKRIDTLFATAQHASILTLPKAALDERPASAILGKDFLKLTGHAPNRKIEHGLASQAPLYLVGDKAE